jgi:putative hydrolase of the HAD superfamily
MAGVAAVLFDLDGTLCEYERSAEELLTACFDDLGIEPFFGEGEYLGRYAEFAGDHDDVREIREACFGALADEAGHDRSVGVELASRFADVRDHSNVRFTPGAEDGVTAIAESHAIGIVTNGGPWMQSQKLAGLGLEDRFETVVHAGYDAPPKPEPDPFHRALEELGVTGGRAVHVGNSLVSDVPGAKAAGLEAAWLDDGSDHRGEPDYVLDSLADLTDPPWA